MPRLIYTTFDGVRHAYSIPPGTTAIGRTPNNDLQIDELELSSHHCTIELQENAIIVKDLQSVSGTFVDGEPVTEAKVSPGQIISLGSFLLTLNGDDDGSIRSLRAEQGPAQLKDGSYSCLRHTESRAKYECENCFDLACEKCACAIGQSTGAPKAKCNFCGGDYRLIDWSGLEKRAKDVLVDLFVPQRVKKVMNLWEQHKHRLRPKKPGES